MNQAHNRSSILFRHRTVKTAWLIAVGGELVAQDAGGGATLSVYYFHRDHLGSIVAISDYQSNQIAHFDYDAWGQRRASTGVPTLAPQDIYSINIANDVITSMGYTGHEMLDGVGLIHMKGRVYDPRLGRFLSADPVMLDPANGQALNAYSYVGNNPLSATDPTGLFLSKLWKGIKKFAGAIVGVVLTLVTWSRFFVVV